MEEVYIPKRILVLAEYDTQDYDDGMKIIAGLKNEDNVESIGLGLADGNLVLFANQPLGIYYKDYFKGTTRRFDGVISCVWHRYEDEYSGYVTRTWFKEIAYINLLDPKFKNSQTKWDDAYEALVRQGLDEKVITEISPNNNIIPNIKIENENFKNIWDDIESTLFTYVSLEKLAIEKGVQDVEEANENIKRLTRYTKGFKNLRKFLSPLYYHYDHPLSRYLLGEGYIQMIGIKK